MAWIEVKVCYNRQTGEGAVKRVAETYLVNALSCTEAEARVTEELIPFISGELRTLSVVVTKINEIFRFKTGDRFYKVKVNFLTIDEKTGIEKKTASYILVEADTFDEAYSNFLSGMSDTVADYEIEQLIETKITDVFNPKNDEETL